MVTVRRLRPDDWRGWREFRNRSLADAPDAFGTTLAESLLRDDAWWTDRVLATATSDDDAMFVAADDAGRWLGAAGGHRDERSVQLISVWTAPEARGRRVGERTCRAVLDWAVAIGEPRVRLWVVDGNAAALALYRRLGFAATGRVQPLRDELVEREYAVDLAGAAPDLAEQAREPA